MSTRFIQAHIGNAIEMAERTVPSVVNAQVSFKGLVRFCGHYRRLGIALLFLFAERDALQQYLWKSGRAYLHVLPRLPEADKATSRGKPFFDAVAALDFDGARAIAAASRATRAGVEYEEDFLFPHFLMQRFFLRQDDAADAALLQRWEQVLEGSPDPRLDVAKALFARDAAAFDDGLDRWLESVEARFAVLAERELELDETISTEGKLSVEGLALCVLAERLGMPTRPDYLFVPSLARARAPLALPPDAWMRVHD